MTAHRRALFAASALAVAFSPLAVSPAAGETSSSLATTTARWPQFGFGPAHLGRNPREHSLRPGTVGQLERTRVIRGRSVAQVTNAGSLVYSVGGRTLRALDRNTGRVVWSRPEVETPTPAVVGGLVFAGTDSGVLLALDAATGRMRWRTSLTSGDALSTPPTVAGGLLFIGAVNNRVYAVDLASHDVRWVFATDAALLATSAAVADGTAYFGSAIGTLYAVDVASGQERWHVPVPEAPNPPPPVVAGHCVLVAAPTVIHCFQDRDGFELWARGGGTELVTQPTVFGERVIWTQGRHVYSSDLRTGSTRTAFTSPHRTPLEPVTLAGDTTRHTVAYAMSGRHLLAVALGGRRGSLVADIATSRPEAVRLITVADGRVYVSGGRSVEFYAR